MELTTGDISVIIGLLVTIVIAIVGAVVSFSFLVWRVGTWTGHANARGKTLTTLLERLDESIQDAHSRIDRHTEHHQ
ncbi:hypothetical protein LCGC14_3065190 [marine sediment metagenome]|uniref:Uncharacterized protein n=1 Tax=marine sediment metagenome TaxID=412755 RepID=A0A0F8Z8H6_9ZZZZ